jgi:hypothetical protein
VSLLVLNKCVFIGGFFIGGFFIGGFFIGGFFSGSFLHYRWQEIV